MQIKNIKKLYYSIGDVSQMTGLKQYVLRYWETEFSILNPAKNRAGNRTYKDEDIKIIRHIKELLYEKKFTIRGAKQYLEEYYSDKSKASSNVVAISSQNVDREFLLDLKKKLQETINMIDKLKA
jgi:DNA-binding transcriptional MerR regulator